MKKDSNINEKKILLIDRKTPAFLAFEFHKNLLDKSINRK